MRFHLIDQVREIEAGKRIVAVKNLTLGEEYLADHFPAFPVMPGVLMLEALTQAAAWLIRVTEDFAHSMIVLREARGVKYGTFVEPGRTLVVTVEWSEKNAADGKRLQFKGTGEVDGVQAVSARFGVERYNLSQRGPAWGVIDEQLKQEFRSRWRLLAPAS